MLFPGNRPLGLRLDGGPVFGRKYRPGKPAQAQSEVLHAVQEVVGRGASVLKDRLEVLRRGFHQLLVADGIEGFAPGGAFAAYASGFLWAPSDELVHDVLPGALDHLGVVGGQIENMEKV